MDDPIEVDPSKLCTQRYDHRAIGGEDRPEGRVCPACFPAVE